MKKNLLSKCLKIVEVMEPERELVLLLNDGDEAAFEKLYHLYSIRILKKLVLILKDEEIAKEVLQDTFMTIWEKRKTVNPDKSFRSYLFRIAENKIVDVFRKVGRDKKLLNHLIKVVCPFSEDMEQAVLLKETNGILQEAINNLPPQRKKIFILCRIEGKTYEEAGKILGISTGTVNDHMVKASRALKASFSRADLAALLFISLLN